jgi:peptide/nickel transport system permease protein
MSSSTPGFASNDPGAQGFLKFEAIVLSKEARLASRKIDSWTSRCPLFRWLEVFAIMTFLSHIREFLRSSFPGRLGFSLSLLLVILALAAPLLAPSSPTAQNLPARLESPSHSHWMGTDELGRDVFSRILYGARVSMLVSVCVVFGAGLTGLAIGSLAGYWGGWLDRIVNIILINAFLSFPGILLAIAFAAFLGPGIGKVILALIVTGWAGYARLARAQVLQVREMEFILAARSLGASSTRILLRHVLPNILQPILVQATIAMAGAILAESTLSFLGVGVLAPMPSWGAMLNDARDHLFDAPHLVLFPALAVATAVLAFNLLGDALRDYLDPRLRSQLGVTLLAR